MPGDALPHLKTNIPGPRSRALARQLHRYESRNVTYISRTWPVFWKRAVGANVWDVDGNRYIDLTAAFGVASVGHTNPRVSAALQKQAGQLLHAMGDVHPNELKLRLARELCQRTFKGPARVVFGNSGAEAVEIALKTAAIHTKRPGVIAFTGAYHGLTYGALAVTSRRDFREPFRRQLRRFTKHIPFGMLPSSAADCGAVIVEPIQGRGGIIVPPDQFLPALRKFCDRHKLVLIFDEIYTGFCRTGRWFAGEHWKVIPDVFCVGKGMTGGFPMSACIGRAQVMDSWPESEGEAIHTSTFLGNPLGCAAALAAIGEIKRLKLDLRSRQLGEYVKSKLPVRGKGLMLGLPVKDAPQLCEQLLRAGILALPEGEHGEVLGLTPPLTITRRQLDFCVNEITKRL
jgi:4-aminobutyrate aminotransferase/(S)-3-amino-2-methylpropionate transaminase